MPNTLQFKRGALSGLPSLSAGEPGFTTDQIRLYVGSAGGNRLVGLLHNNAATTAPAVNDDAGDGYSVGSTWTDTTSDKTYTCADSTVGAAVWKETSGLGSGTVAVADGGTGRTSHAAYAVLCGGTTSTGAQQSVASAGTAGQVLTSNGAGALPTFEDLPGGTAIAFNALRNGGMDEWQRGTATSTAADDSYYTDGWYVLTQTTTANVNQGSGDTKTVLALQLANSAAAQRMGVAQIVENEISRELRGQSVRFQFRAKASTATTIRFAVLEWTGSANAVTSDVVGTWTSGTYTAGNFFVASNVSVAAVSSGSATTSYADFAVTASIGSSCNHVIVFVWTENALATSDSITVTECGLYSGTDAQEWRAEDPAVRRLRCRRQLAVYTSERVGLARNGDYLYGVGRVWFGVPMRATPTLSGASFAVNTGSAGTVQALSATATGCALRNSANNWTTDAIVDFTGTFSAEL